MAKGKREVIQLLATEFNLPLKEIQRVVSAQFLTVSETIASGTFDEIRLPKFGVFKSREGRREKLTEIKKKKHAEGKSVRSRK